MPLKKKVFLLTALIYIIYLIFPLFGDAFRIPVWLPSMTTVLVLVYLYPKAFANKTIYWFLLYALVLGIYVLIGRPLTIGIGTVADSKKILIEFAYILPAISIFVVLYYLDDHELMKKMVVRSLVVLLVSFIVTAPMMIKYNSLRDILSKQEQNLVIIGLPSYSLMHAYTLFVPLMCYIWKVMKGWKKRIALSELLVLCVVIYYTFVTTSLIIAVAILFISIIYSDKNYALMWIIYILIALVLYILYEFGFFISVIDWIMPAFEDTAVKPKLLDFKASMLQGEVTGNTLTIRQERHSISWNSFFQNPFFGTSITGAHSSLIDRFGGMGAVAGIPFLMILVSFIRQMVRRYQTRKAKTFFWIGIFVGFLFLYMKGNWGSEDWLVFMVLMPMGILTFENEINNNETKVT